MKKVLVVTGTRAEYGLLRWVIDGIAKSNLLELQLCTTGMHLSPEFGLTYKEIEADGYQIDSKIEMLLSADTPSAITKSMGLGLIGFADELNRLKPDLILILGDRYEIMCAGMAATVARIPIAHLHGGEATEGCIDEAIRHSITKMSHLHFVAAEKYRKRVIQLGENPNRVFCVGGLGIDNILKLNLLSKQELEDSLDFKLSVKSMLVTFHPVTLEGNTSGDQMRELLASLSEFKDYKIIFTMPNADTDGREIFKLIESFCLDNHNCRACTSLGQLRYLSCLKYVDIVVGNSSSGLAEVPSFKIPTVNIGDRQKGRLKAGSVIDCSPKKNQITSAINRAVSLDFKESCKVIKNPYGKGGASQKIVQTIESITLKDIIKKSFHDIKLR
ncbi:MAG: UDP-N-acetylglucosamine 2-epimerase [Verrucomicrobia bacterium]|nr:UDP-N-acetylglucosamine 2-epimerase [Verrucomicrobiota bacterium]